MRSAQIVFDPPCLDDLAGIAIVGEEMLVEAFVPETAVDALDEAVLHRLARCDVVLLTQRSCCHFNFALTVSSAPLSLTTSKG